jgi:hypothetical protein
MILATFEQKIRGEDITMSKKELQERINKAQKDRVATLNLTANWLT